MEQSPSFRHLRDLKSTGKGKQVDLHFMTFLDVRGCAFSDRLSSSELHDNLSIFICLSVSLCLCVARLYILSQSTGVGEEPCEALGACSCLPSSN